VEQLLGKLFMWRRNFSATGSTCGIMRWLLQGAWQSICEPLMFTVDQLVAHAVGDYLLQSEWMAVEKTKRSVAALVHCVFYLLPFLFITQNPYTLAVMGGTHFVIDRWHLARYVAWLKNRPWPGSAPWYECSKTGFHPDTQPWLAGWLVIIIDNVMHILINGLAIAYIG
jgi:hypothetical protein